MTNPNPVSAVADDDAERRTPYSHEVPGRIATTSAAAVRGRWLAYAALILLASLSGQTRAAPSHLPGTLANPGFEGQPMKSVYFFAGQWRFPGPASYDGAIPGVGVTPASNDCLYTIFPSDGDNHLGWSERPEKRELRPRGQTARCLARHNSSSSSNGSGASSAAGWTQVSR